MPTIRITLIQRLSSGKAAAWEEMDRIYRPLIRAWLRRFSLQMDDTEDISQEVMIIMFREIPQFEHNGRLGAFRNWLRTTTVNVARNYLRRKNVAQGSGSSEAHEVIAQLEDPSSSLSHEFDVEHDRWVVRALLESVAKRFEPITLEIFRTHVVNGHSAMETAGRLEVSIATVHTAKS